VEWVSLMAEEIVYYQLARGCGHSPQKSCLLESLRRQRMSFARMRCVRGFSSMSSLGEDKYEVECWRGRERCFDRAGLLVLKRVEVNY